MVQRKATNVQPWNDGAELIPKGCNREAKTYKVLSISEPNNRNHATAKVKSDEDTFLIDATLLPHKTDGNMREWAIEEVTFRLDDGRITIM